MTEETPPVTPSNEQAATEEKPSNEQTTTEPVANPEFINWKYPPYCELCSVHFCGESNSKKHFEEKNHKNKLHLWRKCQESEVPATNSKNVLCKICWKEMNTQKILDAHCTSPAHLKVEKGRLIVQRLKEEYKQLRELQ